MQQRNVMLSASWFSPEEAEFLEKVKASLHANETISDFSWCLDKDGQWGETDVTLHPEVALDQLWSTRTFLNDVTSVKNAEVIVHMIVPGHEDTGSTAEAAMAYAWGTPVLAVLPDQDYDDMKALKAEIKTHGYRDELLSEIKRLGVNLMPAKLADVVIPYRELATYNFGHLRNRPYDGPCY